MQEKIIEFLKKKHDYISGDYISQRLGITRQGLWKHIQDLKEAGYDIEAVPHLGYRLASVPDRLYAVEISGGLHTRVMASRIYYFDTVSSTMDIAVKLGFERAAEGTLVVAESQTKGRGRLGREWLSPKYKGIYASLILRPKIVPSRAAALTLMTAVSICEAISSAAGLEAQIKWPNDIYIGDKKVGGILTELSAETDGVNFVVIGFGINVNNEARSLLHTAASLKERGKEAYSRVGLLQEILRRQESNYTLFLKEGFTPLAQRWRAMNMTLGRRVKAHVRGGQLEGEAFDIDNDGALLIRTDTGLTEKITAGDVVHCR